MVRPLLEKERQRHMLPPSLAVPSVFCAPHFSGVLGVKTEKASTEFSGQKCLAKYLRGLFSSVLAQVAARRTSGVSVIYPTQRCPSLTRR